MEVAVTLLSGMVDRSSEFVVLYRNQFGLVCMAYSKPGAGLVGFLAPESQVQWSETDPFWPDGSASGTFDPVDQGS